MIVVITNRHLLEGGDLFHQIIGACKGGASHIMLREKDLNDCELYELAKKVKNITDHYGKKLIINNNIEVANKVEAYSVQLSISGLKGMTQCRTKIGVSIHSYDEAILGIRKGADYLVASHMYETDCKLGLKPNGIQLIEGVRMASSIPMIALGGINKENCSEPIQAGAQGIAIMSAVMRSENPEKVVGEIKSRL